MVAKILKEMDKKSVRDMLILRAGPALELGNLNDKYEDVFCGCSLDYKNTIHIWGPDNLMEIANILDKKIWEEERKNDKEYPKEIYFYEELFGKQWRVFALVEGKKDED